MMSVPAVAVLAPVIPHEFPGDVPRYWRLRHLLTFILIIVPAALFTAYVAPGIASRSVGAGGNSDMALAVGAIVALATPVLTYGSVFFSHMPAGLLAGTAFAIVTADSADVPLRPLHGFIAGLLASTAVLTEYPTALLAFVVAAALVIERRRLRALPAFAAGAAIGAVALLAYNRAAWGNAFTTGYAFKASAEHAAIHANGFFGVTIPTAERLWGVLFSARRGLLFYCPLLLAIPLGWARSWKIDRRATALSIAVVVLYVAFASGFVDWEAGWSAAARHLVPAIPLLVGPLAAGIVAMLSGRATRIALGVLAAWSVGAAILSVGVTPWFPELFANPLGDVALRSLGEGVAMQNLLTDFVGVPQIAVFALWAALTISLVAFALRAIAAGEARRAVLVAFGVTLLVQPVILTAASHPAPDAERARAELLHRLGFDDAARTIMERTPR
jgi:hypothetical protein